MKQAVSKDFKKYAKITDSAVQFYKKNKITEAQKTAAKLLYGKWDHGLHFFYVGVAAQNAGDNKTALRVFDHALSLKESNQIQYSEILMAKGLSLSNLGQFEKAIEIYTTAIKASPENDKIYNNRAIAYWHIGQWEDALNDLRKAYGLNPSDEKTFINLIRSLIQRELVAEATELVKKSQILFQNNPHYWIIAGELAKKESPLEALKYYRKATYLDPQNAYILNQYATVFERLSNLQNFEGLDQDLLLLLSNNLVQWEKLKRIIPLHLKSTSEFKEILPALSLAVQNNQDLNLDYGKVVKVMTNNVLLASLKRRRLSDPDIEKLLETFRRQTLAALSSDVTLDPALSKLLLTILIPFAHYCFSCEYVFSENEFETTYVEKQIKELQNSNKYSTENALKFVILACYRLPFFTSILVKTGQKWLKDAPSEIKELIKVTISEPLREQKILQEIPQLTEINNEISLNVRTQYEENPYPRWNHFPISQGTRYATNLARILPALKGKSPDLPEQPDVLIAGCGTGKQPISTALAYPETKILAVDLSLASIAYAKRKTAELKIKNIEYGQADIMELKSLDKKFDVIECGGVLHHMQDPIAGWRVLCDILKDDGFMMIALYSELGRRDIVAAREFIQKEGYANNVEGIRACRKHILSLDDDNLAKRVSRHGDFYTTSACRDLIFHVQEHRFTIEGLKHAFHTLNMEFLGFSLELQFQEELYKKSYPDDTMRTNLDNWQKFEEDNPDFFSAMYKFWIRKRKSI